MAKAGSEYLLIIANSGRMLAQSAAKAGYRPLVIDLYGDSDTCRYSEECCCLPSLAKEFLLPAVDRFVARYGVSFAVYGSGFECFQPSLVSLAKKLTVWGNSPEIFSQFNNKRLFFNQLKNMSIPFPEVRFVKPTAPDGWLFKPFSGFGGVEISYFNGKLKNTPGYWQQYQAGHAHSALFVVDGVQARTLGFNRQWTIKLNDENEFIFSGIINATDLTAEQKQVVSVWVDQLAAVYTLKGLNSLDFIRQGSEVYLLEINPRPPASLQLYGGDLLTLHIKACQGELSDNAVTTSPVCGVKIIYANRPIRIPGNFSWPPGAMDIPKAGSLINTHQPICSIIARQNKPETVLRQLNQTQDFILNQLARLQIHGI